MRPRQRALPPSQQMLALPAPSGSGSSAQPKNNRKAKGARGKGNAGKKSESKSSGKGCILSFEQIMDMGPQNEDFEESLAECSLESERLRDVVS